MAEARHWHPLEDGRVQCELCRHYCKIAEGRSGLCQVRENRDGILHTLTYDRVIARSVDPIEKKPLFHFLPGSRSYSIATPGCNFRCRHCQNADIAQMPRDHGEIAGLAVPPPDLVEDALKNRCASISYTYTEPTVFYELAFDTAVLAHARGLRNVFVTNGYTGEGALREISPFLDAANIDLKGFTEEFYERVCGARLEKVMETIRLYHDLGIWIEVTTLVIPSHNDNPDDLRGIARFIAGLDPAIPWHVSRFHPTYRLTDQPSTPVETLEMARAIGLEEGLRYVYAGNVPGAGGEHTRCPGCGRSLIERRGFTVTASHLKAGRCPGCGYAIDGVEM